MDYEKKYKEALERARQFSEHPLQEDSDSIVEYIFPELKESEDERIRKEIVRFIQMEVEDEIVGNKWLDWLKKQGGRNNYDNNVITRNDKMLQAISIGLSDIKEDVGWSDFGGTPIEEIQEWLEKQGEQKPTDKAEPKFHEGEWITNGDYTWKIIEVKPLDYILQSQDGNIVDDTISHVDEQFHSFTIEDAKPGDVLIDKSSGRECPFIFKETKPSNIKTDVLNPLVVLGYCGIGGAGFTKGSGWGDTVNCVYYPATKEQRDLLFQKMKEGGYEWDSEKKELKKVEQKQSFDIEMPYGAKDSELQEVSYYIPEGFHAEIEGNKVIIKKGEQKPALSEEDKDIINHLLAICDGAKKFIQFESCSREDVTKCQDWLKSIKFIG